MWLLLSRAREGSSLGAHNCAFLEDPLSEGILSSGAPTGWKPNGSNTGNGSNGNSGEGNGPSPFSLRSSPLPSRQGRHGLPRLFLLLLLPLSALYLLHWCCSAEAAGATGRSLQEDLGYRQDLSPNWSLADKYTDQASYPSSQNADPQTKHASLIKAPNTHAAAAEVEARPTAPKPEKTRSKIMIAGLLGLAVVLALGVWGAVSTSERIAPIRSSEGVLKVLREPSRSHRSGQALADLAQAVNAAEKIQPHLLHKLTSMEGRLRSAFTTAKGMDGCDELAKLVQTVKEVRMTVLSGPIDFLRADTCEGELGISHRTVYFREQMDSAHGQLLDVGLKLARWASRRATSNATLLEASWETVNERIAALEREAIQAHGEERVTDTYLRALKTLAFRLRQDINSVKAVAERASQTNVDIEPTQEKVVDLLTVASQFLHVSEARHARGTATLELMNEWFQRGEAFLHDRAVYGAKYKVLTAWPAFLEMEIQRLQVLASSWASDSAADEFDMLAVSAQTYLQTAVGALRENDAAKINAFLESAVTQLNHATKQYSKLKRLFTVDGKPTEAFTPEKKEALEASMLCFARGVAECVASKAVEFAGEAARNATASGVSNDIDLHMTISRCSDIRRASAVDTALTLMGRAHTAASWVSSSTDVDIAMDNLMDLVDSAMSILSAGWDAKRNQTMSLAGSLIAKTADMARDQFYDAANGVQKPRVPSADSGPQRVELLYRLIFESTSAEAAIDLCSELMNTACGAEDAALNEGLIMQETATQRLVREITDAEALETAKSQLALKACTTRVLAQATIEQLEDMVARAAELETPLATAEGTSAAPRIRAASRNLSNLYANIVSSCKRLAEAQTVEDMHRAGKGILLAMYSLVDVTCNSRVLLYNALVSMHEAKLPDPQAAPSGQDMTGSQQPKHAEESAAAYKRATLLLQEITEKKEAASELLKNADRKVMSSVTSQMNAEAVLARRIADYVMNCTQPPYANGGSTATQLLTAAYDCLTYLQDLNMQFDLRLHYVQNMLELDSSLTVLETQSHQS